MAHQIINFYIDDTGTKELADLRTYLFAYIGISIMEKNEDTIVEKISSLKMKYFKTTDVELKSTWLRIPEHRFMKYVKPYNISERELYYFTVELFNTIRLSPIHCIGSVVDKNRLLKTYRKILFDPSPVCYELLLQRIANYATQYFIDEVNIFIDDMSGKNITGSEWKELLIKYHRKLKKGYSPLYRTWIKRKKMDYSRICEDIVFIDSKDSVLIQIADLCAYNVMRQAREYWCNFDNPPFYKGYSWIKPIMHCNPKSGQILRFGVVNFPSN